MTMKSDVVGGVEQKIGTCLFLFRGIPVFRTLLAASTAIAVFTHSPVSAADDLPVGLKYIPADAAMFLHLDLGALEKTDLGKTLMSSKLAQTIVHVAEPNTYLGASLKDVKTLTYVVPNLNDPDLLSHGISVVTYRQKYDRDKLIAECKVQVAKTKAEVVLAGNILKLTRPTPFSPSSKLTSIHDLTDDTRIVSVYGLGEEYLKPKEKTGLHSESIKRHAGAPMLAGMNMTALPEQLRQDDLPPEVRPYRPILMADGVFVVGISDGDELSVQVSVKSKTKADAAEVEKSLDAARQLARTTISESRKTLKDTVAKPEEMAVLFDVLERTLRNAKFVVSDTSTTATVSVPLDAPFGPFFEYLGGGGTAGRAVSSNNLKQLALAFHNYESAHQFFPNPASLGKKGKKLLSWRVEILPYVEHEELYKQFHHDEPWDSEHNMKVMKENPMPRVFALPNSTDEDDKNTHYQVFVGNGAMFDLTAPTRIGDITDGTSNTFLIATAANPVEWTKPDDIEFDPKAAASKLLLYQDKVTLIAFGDGSVRAISETVPDKVINAYITRGGGEVITDE